MIQQFEITLPNYGRGFHLVTHLIKEKLKDLPEKGLINLFIQHTSAALTLNENYDPSVRYDFESFINKLIPENSNLFTHTLEGRDDMPAHLKSSLFGQSISIPVTNHKMNLGTWQGIYLCEFRDGGEKRNIVITIYS